MKMIKQKIEQLLLCLIFVILILDVKTSFAGARDGLMLCIYTVIPSLFPFMVLTSIINSKFQGKSYPLFHPVCRICGIPYGAESIFLLGLLGGYPVGAKGVIAAYHDKLLSKQDARRMLGFCNNAGPAFIFGMLSSLFKDPLCPWFLWGIHILSAISVGILLPDKQHRSVRFTHERPLTVTKALESGIYTMAYVCGWIILFRVIIGFCKKWFLWIIPQSTQVTLIGFLELSNGCVNLCTLPSQGLRFLIASALLGFGGFCVALQTLSITKDVGWGLYFAGKVLQCVLSVLVAYVFQICHFTNDDRYVLPTSALIVICAPLIIFIFLRIRKKEVAIPQNLMYNSTVS